MIIIISILLIIYIYIELTELLQNSAFNIKYNRNKRLYIKSTDLDYNDNTKIKKVITIDKNNKDEKKYF